MKSIFTDKDKTPVEDELKKALGRTYTYWKELADFTNKFASSEKNEWHYSNSNFGWSFRISDKKRVLIYMLPRDKFFKAAFVFGQKATDTIMESKVSDHIKQDLQKAKVYAEGRGIRIEVKDKEAVEDIKQLITIKITN